MPTAAQATLNPNDYTSSMKGGPGFQKKQFTDVNQHIFHHNAVLPGNVQAEKSGARASAGPPNPSSPYYKDPYANIAMKPTQMSKDNSNQLQKNVSASTPAGVISELRKSSPGGHRNNPDERSGRSRELAANNSLTRIGQESAGRAANAMMYDYRVPDYGSIQKVMPKSRDMNPMGAMDNHAGGFSSKPQTGPNYQSL